MTFFCMFFRGCIVNGVNGFDVSYYRCIFVCERGHLNVNFGVLQIMICLFYEP